MGETVFDRRQSTNKAPAAFITFPRTPDGLTRSDIIRLCRDAFGGLEGGLIAKEKHKDGSTHYHAAIFGTFIRKNAFPKFQKFVQGYSVRDEISMKDAACHMQFAHSGGKKWPFTGTPKPDMIDYLSVGGDHKPDEEIDKNSRAFVLNETDTGKHIVYIRIDELRDAYMKFDPAAGTGILGRMQTVVGMAQAGASRDDVIMEIGAGITKENSFEYQILMDLFKATDKYIAEAPYPDFEPNAWQQLIIDRMMLKTDPKDNNYRGIWLCTPAGGGKSTVLRMLEHYAGLDNVFTPTLKNNTYGPESLNGYEQQPIIIIDDVRAFTNSNQEVLHKGAFIAFAKAIASGDRISYQLYGKRHDFLVNARVLITSNFPMPHLEQAEEMKAFQRRYIEIDTTDEHRIAGLLNLPRDLGYRGGLLMPVRSRPTTPVSPAPAARSYTPPSSGNPAPRRRVRFNDDTFVFGPPDMSQDSVVDVTTGVANLNYDDQEEHKHPDAEFDYGSDIGTDVTHGNSPPEDLDDVDSEEEDDQD